MIYALNSTEITLVDGGKSATNTIKDWAFTAFALYTGAYAVFTGGVAAAVGFIIGGPVGIVVAVSGWVMAILPN